MKNGCAVCTVNHCGTLCMQYSGRSGVVFLIFTFNDMSLYLCRCASVPQIFATDWRTAQNLFLVIHTSKRINNEFFFDSSSTDTLYFFRNRYSDDSFHQYFPSELDSRACLTTRKNQILSLSTHACSQMN